MVTSIASLLTETVLFRSIYARLFRLMERTSSTPSTERPKLSLDTETEIPETIQIHVAEKRCLRA